MLKPLRVIFAGTPPFAAESLAALLQYRQTFHLAAVYTQPDRPAGRGRQLQVSAVKTLAQQQRLPVEQPQHFGDADALTRLAAYQADVMAVVAYGMLLPQAVLDTPRHGCVNVHASLLPRWRGAAPVERAMLAGDSETGVTLMRIESKLDAGAILAQARLPINSHDNAGVLHAQLGRLGAELLVAQLPRYLGGEITPQTQDESRVTYAAKLTRAETRLNWALPAAELTRRVRAYTPRLGAVATLNGLEIKIWACHPLAGRVTARAGSVVAHHADGIEVATADGLLCITQLQAPGKRVMGAADFINGNRQLFAVDGARRDYDRR